MKGCLCVDFTDEHYAFNIQSWRIPEILRFFSSCIGLFTWLNDYQCVFHFWFVLWTLWSSHFPLAWSFLHQGMSYGICWRFGHPMSHPSPFSPSYHHFSRFLTTTVTEFLVMDSVLIVRSLRSLLFSFPQDSRNSASLVYPRPLVSLWKVEYVSWIQSQI